MMTAAGVAWGLFETWQNSQPGQASGRGQGDGNAPARADGALGGGEREAILEQARSVGAEAFVLGELDRTTPLSEIAAGVSDAREKDDAN